MGLLQSLVRFGALSAGLGGLSESEEEEESESGAEGDIDESDFSERLRVYSMCSR